MAVIKLGAFITDIAGSVGGTTFRRIPNGISITNKTRGSSRDRLLKNKALPLLTSIVNGWSNLNIGIKNLWIQQTLNFQFPDKFGDLKNLSGRQLYIKLNSQALFNNIPPPDVTALSSVVLVPEILSIVADTSPSIVIVLKDPINNQSINVQAQPIASKSVGFSVTNRQIFFSEFAINEDTFNLGKEFFEKFRTVQDGDFFNFYIYYTNTSGFRSQTLLERVQIVG